MPPDASLNELIRTLEPLRWASTDFRNKILKLATEAVNEAYLRGKQDAEEAERLFNDQFETERLTSAIPNVA